LRDSVKRKKRDSDAKPRKRLRDRESQLKKKLKD
jgi:hypothetical protein